jgi:glutathione S-transferase
MELYFSPLACSAASRITLYEAGQSATFIEVDAKTKRTHTGQDFRAVHPLGLVPTLRLAEGDILTENAAILQYLAERFPEAGLVPAPGLERARLQQWLCFIGTELHKGVFTPLFDREAPEAVQQYALKGAQARLELLERHLRGREFLLECFSVADAYLVVVLNWAVATPIKLEGFPSVSAYLARLRKRPSVARALHEELALYRRELAAAAQTSSAP